MADLHLTNAKRRNAVVSVLGTPKPLPPRPALPDGPVIYVTYVAAGPGRQDAELTAQFGTDDYGEQLVAGDPEVDLESVGRLLPRTDTVYLSHKGEVLTASPTLVEAIEDPFGRETERREPQERLANVTDEEAPLQWTGRKVPIAEAVRRFVFRRTVQVVHKDGVTYDFLYEIAKELAEDKALMLLGGGEKGRDPLVMVRNGTPYRGFLEGRIKGEAYMLLLHLSAMELKAPPEPPPADSAEED